MANGIRYNNAKYTEAPEGLLQKVLAKYRVTETGCWEWLGRLDQDGYGQTEYWDNERQCQPKLLVHRFAYFKMVGDAGNAPIDHTCHNPDTCVEGRDCPHRRCINPEHLKPVSEVDNVLRSNSPLARNARKTHCVRDHELTPENVYMKAGRRCCKLCAAIHTADWRARKAQAARGDRDG